jgi:hypothetical protein
MFLFVFILNLTFFMAILYIQTSVQAGIIGMSVTCGACRGTGKIVKVWGTNQLFSDRLYNFYFIVF